MAETGSEAAEGPGVRIRLDVAYDGTGFSGWARQPDRRTVQGALEGALATIFRRHPPAPSLVVAGRTDAGVHASGQVCHADLTADQVAAVRRRGASRRRPPASSEDAAAAGREPDAGEALARRINGILGAVSDVVVTGAREAPDGFDARFSAVWRRYRYRVADAAAPRDPLQRHRTAWVPDALDVEAMHRSAASLVGLHDFAAYCKAPVEGATTIRTLQEFGWAREADGVLVAEVRADAFCHSMVRALVGACVAVGNGRLAERDPALLLSADRRSSAFRVMPARGLTLEEVGYPPDAELAPRAARTRARRVLP